MDIFDGTDAVHILLWQLWWHVLLCTATPEPAAAASAIADASRPGITVQTSASAGAGTDDESNGHANAWDAFTKLAATTCST